MDPILVRLSFSHYCRKVEWALSHAGIRYRNRDVTFGMLADFQDVHPEGTVPVLVVDGERICGSSHALRWIDSVSDLELYPQPAVSVWEDWADENLGPMARRIAYRTIHATPTHYTRNPALWAVFRAARGVVLNILKFYKARRYEDQDAETLSEAMDRIVQQLDGQEFLFSDHVTAADLATAALMEPLTRIHPDIHPDMPVVRDHVGRVKRGLRRGRRLSKAERARIAALPIRAE